VTIFGKDFCLHRSDLPPPTAGSQVRIGVATGCPARLSSGAAKARCGGGGSAGGGRDWLNHKAVSALPTVLLPRPKSSVLSADLRV